jgi:hypothetical protein
VTPVIALLISLIPEAPGVITAIEKLIERGRKTGELPPAEADALTLLAQSTFAKYSTAAPPPPGVTPGP